MKDKDTYETNLRLPKKLAKKVKEKAKINHRSMNAEITQALTEYTNEKVIV